MSTKFENTLLLSELGSPVFPKPRHFTATIERGLYQFCSVELRNGRLTYFIVEDGMAEEIIVEPTRQQWSDFRQSLDDIGVWNWTGNYLYSGIDGGEQWSLEIIYADRILNTKGNNKYPGKDGMADGAWTESFTKYLKAVKRLLGGKKFGGLEPPVLPQSFKASFKGSSGKPWGVELYNGRLKYYEMVYSMYSDSSEIISEVVFEPTRQQWNDFRQSLDKIGVWNWTGNYLHYAVDKGEQWSLEIIYADRILNTKGNNKYPDRDGMADGARTESFMEYLDAVEILISGKELGWLEPPVYPQSFSARIGEFLADSYVVELHNGSLKYRDTGSEEIVEPSRQQWSDFRQSLDYIGVWNWGGTYSYPDMHHGEWWSLEIAYADRSLRTSGICNYPRKDGTANMDADGARTEPFIKYLAAVERLLGGKKFR